MDIIVNSVGDANCILIKSDGESMMIDCGVKNGCYASIKEQFIGAEFLAADYFLLSHYHDDHYDLLRKLPICKKSVLKKFYYPIIPKLSSSSITSLNNSTTVGSPTTLPIKIGKNKTNCCILAQCILLMQVLHNSVIPLKNFGSPAANILGLLRKRCDRINGAEALYMGKKIKLGSEEYEVIWPPRTFTYKDPGNTDGIAMPKEIVKNINNIFEVLKNNDNLKKVWDKLGEYVKNDTKDEKNENFDSIDNNVDELKDI